MLKNDRLWQAAIALATGEADARERLRVACEIVSKLHPSELNNGQQNKLAEILHEAQRFPAIRDTSGQVIEDAFKQTAKRATNKTAAKLAKKMFDLHEEVNCSK
jgi:hypothetical protein